MECFLHSLANLTYSFKWQFVGFPLAKREIVSWLAAASFG